MVSDHLSGTRRSRLGEPGGLRHKASAVWKASIRGILQRDFWGGERKDTTEQREAGGRVRGEEREREDSIREDNNEHEFLFLLPSGKLPIPSTHIPLRY